MPLGSKIVLNEGVLFFSGIIEYPSYVIPGACIYIYSPQSHFTRLTSSSVTLETRIYSVGVNVRVTA